MDLGMIAGCTLAAEARYLLASCENKWRGKLELFSLDTLVEMAGRVGFNVGIKLSRRRAA